MSAEMVEPDRTIMIVSIIGLVIIWGSFFYHKFVQGGGESQGDERGNGPVVEEESSGGEAGEVGGDQNKSGEGEKGNRRSGKKRGKKKR